MVERKLRPAPSTLHLLPSRKPARTGPSPSTKLFVLDTNVLMHDPTSLFRFEEHDIYLPILTLEELDSHKKGMTEVARNARQASRFLAKLVTVFAGPVTSDIASGIPLLALDMYEHAYHIDFGANAAAYVDTFLRNVDWKAVEGRFEDAGNVAPPRPLVQEEFADLPGVGVEDVRTMLAEGKPLQLIDTRPKYFVSRQQDIAEGVVWRDPERVAEWMGELSKEKPVVVYCAYCFHVGCRTAIALRDAGFDARYMTVGHSGWKAVGAPTRMTP